MTCQQNASVNVTKRLNGGSAECTPTEIRQQKASESGVEAHSNGGGGKSTPKKRVNSRAKGKRGELDLAHTLTAAGFPATRGQQRKGGEDSPDVICETLRGFHIEAKRTATCQMHSPKQLAKWDAQAQRDAGQFRTPLVIHRWNGDKTWWVRVLKPGWPVVWLPLPDFLSSLHIWEPV